MTNQNEYLAALIVDDDTLTRDLLKIFLSTAFPNFIFKMAENGQQAYGQIKLQKPDILYTDVGMPAMSGDMLLEKLVGEGITIPTFVSTGRPTHEQGVRAVFYSHRMYTDEQAKTLQLPVQPTLEAQRRFMETKAPEVRLGADGSPKTKYDYGLTVLYKPYDIEESISKTREVLKVVYRHQS